MPLGYYRVGDDICVGTPDGTRKVRNAERDPRASIVVTGSRASGDWSGVMLQGDLEVVRDADERLALEREARRQRGDDELALGGPAGRGDPAPPPEAHDHLALQLTGDPVHP